MTLLLPALLGCTTSRDALAPRAVRVSMALRGVHPSEDELDALLRGDETLDDAARRWVRDPRFGDTIRDQHAVQLLARWDTEPHPPALGTLERFPAGRIVASLDEEPLRLIERVVTSGRPYGDILTADTTMADEVVAEAYGLAHDPSGPAWQEVPWGDGRPRAGILSSSGLWQRHMSSDTNYQRGRANLLLTDLTCAELDAGGRGVRFPSIAADAVRDDPDCAGCHDRLDPVASAFFGMRRYVLDGEIRDAYRSGCPDGADCYPFSMWNPAAEGTWADVGMPAPAWGGEEVGDLEALGAAAAADPAFAECTARRFGRWFQRVDEPDPAAVDAWTRHFTASGQDARALAVDVVLDPGFLDGPRVWVRPEQAQRLLADLTGVPFDARPPDDWGPVELFTSAEHGMRAVVGGIDGWRSVRPDDGLSAGKELGWAWAASEAAAALVARGEYEGLTGGGEVRGELERRQRAWHADPEPDTAAAEQLFAEVHARTGDEEQAWTVVLTALLLDDRVVGY